MSWNHWHFIWLIYGQYCAAPAWFSLLGNQICERLEKVQRAALKVIKPDAEYEERLECLHIPRLRDFLFDISYAHFLKIVDNKLHTVIQNVWKLKISRSELVLVFFLSKMYFVASTFRYHLFVLHQFKTDPRWKVTKVNVQFNRLLTSFFSSQHRIKRAS